MLKSFTVFSPHALVDLEVKNFTTQDKVIVTGAATVRGTLNVTVDAGYKPGAGEKLALVTATSITGQFDTISIAAPAPWHDPGNANRLVKWDVFKNPGSTEYDLQVMFV